MANRVGVIDRVLVSKNSYFLAFFPVKGAQYVHLFGKSSTRHERYYGAQHVVQIWTPIYSSGFSSSRTNLSPFTKDFRGGDQLDEYLTIFLGSGFVRTDSYQKNSIDTT